MNVRLVLWLYDTKSFSWLVGLVFHVLDFCQGEVVHRIRPSPASRVCPTLSIACLPEQFLRHPRRPFNGSYHRHPLRRREGGHFRAADRSHKTQCAQAEGRPYGQKSYHCTVSILPPSTGPHLCRRSVFPLNKQTYDKLKCPSASRVSANQNSVSLSELPRSTNRSPSRISRLTRSDSLTISW